MLVCLCRHAPARRSVMAAVWQGEYASPFPPSPLCYIVVYTCPYRLGPEDTNSLSAPVAEQAAGAEESYYPYPRVGRWLDERSSGTERDMGFVRSAPTRRCASLVVGVQEPFSQTEETFRICMKRSRGRIDRD